ncbi:MAG: hypothetical protein QXW71_00825 [Thermoplasmata archaeon]
MAKYEPTFLARVPVLSIIEDIRKAVIDFVWKGADVEGIKADNVVKLGIMLGIFLVLGAAIIGNIVYGIFSPLLGNEIGIFLALAFTGFTAIYFVNPRVGKADEEDVYLMPAIFVATITGSALLLLLGQYIAPISNFFAGIFGVKPEAASLLEAFLTASAMIVKSEAVTTTVTLLPVVGSYFLTAGTIALGGLVDFIIGEIKAITKR